MQWLDNLVEKWEQFRNKPRPGLEKFMGGLRKTGRFLAKLWHYLFMFRGLILSAPVATAAAILAKKCASELPESVYVTIPKLAAGSDESLFGFLVFQSETVARGTAITASLVLTLACLLLTMCSKRTFYPWLISVFTLAFPVFLLLTNQYL